MLKDKQLLKDVPAVAIDKHWRSVRNCRLDPEIKSYQKAFSWRAHDEAKRSLIANV
jgi:hypothetical protein